MKNSFYLFILTIATVASQPPPEIKNDAQESQLKELLQQNLILAEKWIASLKAHKEDAIKLQNALEQIDLLQKQCKQLHHSNLLLVRRLNDYKPPTLICRDLLNSYKNIAMFTFIPRIIQSYNLRRIEHS